MVSRVLVWLGVLGVLGGLGGCGKSDGTGPVPEGEIVARIAMLSCDSLANCCANANAPLDVAGCKEAYAAELQQGLRMSSSRVTYDANAAGECLDELTASMQCGRLDADRAPACDRVWRGTVALGKPCDRSLECEPSTFEYVTCSETSSARVCTAMPRASRGSEGEACAYTCPRGGDCDEPAAQLPGPGGEVRALAVCFADDGLYCRAGTCSELVELGGACSDAYACAGSAHCDPLEGLCRALREDGALCTSDGQCESGNCEGADRPTETTLPRCGSRHVVSPEECRP